MEEAPNEPGQVRRTASRAEHAHRCGDGLSHSRSSASTNACPYIVQPPLCPSTLATQHKDREATAQAMAHLDALHRPLLDLRISVTDRCNFRCRYCMPREHFGTDHAFLDKTEILTYEEIANIASSMRPLGLRKIRITGGEPLIRKDIAIFD